MTQVSHRHHINPKFFLAGFTDKGHKRGKLWEFDQNSRMPKRDRAKSVGWVWDYYAVDVPGQPSDVAETLFGKIETSAAPIIKGIVDSEVLPTGADFQILMAFLALMYSRGPTRRFDMIDTLERMQTEVTKMAIRMQAVREQSLNAQKRSKQSSESTLYTDALEALPEDFRLTITNAGEVHTSGVVTTLEPLAQLFAQRNWLIAKVEDPGTFFITTDSSCAIVWDDPDAYRLGPPAPACEASKIIIPIHRSTALIGKFEQIDPSVPVVRLDRYGVALMNFIVSSFATRFLYGPESDFEYWGPDEAIHGWADWYANRPTVFLDPVEGSFGE